ncbi:MAG: type I-B CRISPR-associated protein Cas7/Csh2 [Bacteroidetes bacterium]|nr:MAG: type I-B CRISPR-associated protein Cas7/Csh2 [Bacteroidota bacterium]
MQTTITNSSDFLFIYEAIQCNPNGDPDQENKPRMDYDTKTNLVTDTRVKRFIRDYIKAINTDEVIFVDLEGERKVSMESKLEAIVKRTLKEQNIIETIFADNKTALDTYTSLLKESKDEEAFWKALKNNKLKETNVALLQYLIKEQFIDIRLFGSAFAVEGFTKAYTGPVQLNWGYSLNKVELMDSSSIVTIMNDDSSTFGKDYRVYYSLLAFNGTINKFAAQSTGLTEADLVVFRDAIWQAIPALPTRSKLNQYPKVYVEIIYKEGFANGQFGDLRNYVSATPKAGLTYKQVRKLTDLDLDLSRLKALIQTNKGTVIKEAVIHISPDVSFSLEAGS